jgi:hypothetical protein
VYKTRVLLCAPSNAAIDELVLRITKEVRPFIIAPRRFLAR